MVITSQFDVLETCADDGLKMFEASKLVPFVFAVFLRCPSETSILCHFFGIELAEPLLQLFSTENKEENPLYPLLSSTERSMELKEKSEDSSVSPELPWFCHDAKAAWKSRVSP